MFQYIRNCVSKGVTPVLSLVLRSSLQVEAPDVSGLGHRSPGAAPPPLPQKWQSASLSLWDIATHVQVKVVSAANVNAGDLMKVCGLCLFPRLFIRSKENYEECKCL